MISPHTRTAGGHARYSQSQVDELAEQLRLGAISVAGDAEPQEDAQAPVAPGIDPAPLEPTRRMKARIALHRSIEQIQTMALSLFILSMLTWLIPAIALWFTQGAEQSAADMIAKDAAPTLGYWESFCYSLSPWLRIIADIGLGVVIASIGLWVAVEIVLRLVFSSKRTAR